MLIKALKISLLITALFFVGCGVTPPKNQDNICAIFKEKSGWYKPTRKSSERWGSPVSTIIAFLYQESRFIHNAKPPRKYYLGFIPGPRPSDAYGYAQVKNGTWDDYKKATKNRWADRDDFNDVVDFIGWYNHTSHVRNKIALNNTAGLYLAYHEGHGGFARGTYKSKPWLVQVSNKVAKRSAMYQAQLQSCEKDLRKTKWFFGLF